MENMFLKSRSSLSFTDHLAVMFGKLPPWITNCWLDTAVNFLSYFFVLLCAHHLGIPLTDYVFGLILTVFVFGFYTFLRDTLLSSDFNEGELKYFCKVMTIVVFLLHSVSGTTHTAVAPKLLK